MLTRSKDRPGAEIKPEQVGLLDRAALWAAQRMWLVRVARVEVLLRRSDVKFLEPALSATPWEIVSCEPSNNESHVRANLCKQIGVNDSLHPEKDLAQSLEVALSRRGVEARAAVVDLRLHRIPRLQTWRIEYSDGTRANRLSLHCRPDEPDVQALWAQLSPMPGTRIRTATADGDRGLGRIPRCAAMLYMVVSLALLVAHNGNQPHEYWDITSWSTWAAWTICIHTAVAAGLGVLLGACWLYCRWQVRGISPSTKSSQWRIKDFVHAKVQGGRLVQKLRAAGRYVALVDMMLIIVTGMPWQGFVQLLLVFAYAAVLAVVGSLARVLTAFPRRKYRWWRAFEVGSVLVIAGVSAHFLADDLLQRVGVQPDRIDIPGIEVARIGCYVLGPAVVGSALFALMWCVVKRTVFSPLNIAFAVMLLASTLALFVARVASMETTAARIGRTEISQGYGYSLEPVCVAAISDNLSITSNRHIGTTPVAMWRLGSYRTETILAERDPAVSPRHGELQRLQPTYVPTSGITVTVTENRHSRCEP